MLKRAFDILMAMIGLILAGWLIILLFLGLTILYRSSGLFHQIRVGRHGKHFTIYKLRTIHPRTGNISTFSAFLRRSKLDELPQIVNVLFGDMSIVGPRPDIPGYYDTLQGEERKILELRPGLTSEASIKYYDEEGLLARVEDPTLYNDTVIFPDKVRMNLQYFYKKSFWLDFRIIWKTIFR